MLHSSFLLSYHALHVYIQKLDAFHPQKCLEFTTMTSTYSDADTIVCCSVEKNKPNSYKFPVVGINISTKIVLMQGILWFKCKIHARLTENVVFFDELVQITRSSRSLNRFQYDLNFHLLNCAPWFPFVRC